jgi:transposase
MSMGTQPIDVTLDGLRQLNRRIERHELQASDYPLFGALIENLIGREENKLERMAAKAAAATATQKSQDASAAGPPPPPDPEDAKGEKKKKVSSKGHGRNGAVAFSKAKHFPFSLPSNTIGSLCPDCRHARLKRYRSKRVIRVIGQPLFCAEIYEAEQARCPGCGRTHAAPLPAKSEEGIGKHVIYDWSAAAMLLVLHYTGGLPFKRLEQLHQSWGIPFSDANQWEVVRQAIDYLQPLLTSLENHAVARVRTLKIDDTGSMVLETQQQIIAEIEAAKALGLSVKNIRTGINATCARLETPEAAVILFFTGRHHAGEICERILAKRSRQAEDRIIKLTDAAAKNFDHDQSDKVIEAACNAHAFLKFHDIKDQFPEEYAVVGQAYAQIFANDALAREQKMTPEDRLKLHQEKSRPWMEKIKHMCASKLKEKLVEPRSPLWAPVTFFINQWSRLTKFLEVPGVPLDTNLVEQDLIIPVRYLAASFNYRTLNGAEVGDGAMSLTATARACGVEPVEYLEYCLKHHQDLKLHPEKYLPWVYRDRAKDRAPDELFIEIT